MKRFIKTIIFSMVLVYLTHLVIFKNTFTKEAVSNAFFVVGLMMFFLSLILITNAPRVFLIFRYSFRQAFRRKDNPYKSYYDYYADKSQEKTTPYALPIFVMSIIYLGISLILAHLVLTAV